FIGGFSLLILAIGTRVTLSHGGYDLAEEQRSWPLRIGVTFALVALLARLGAPFAAASYFAHLAWASLLWIAGIIWWSGYIVRRIRAA
ncbi:MAG TPA: NnrS family protein, partial [Vicinamibacterales bacterium]|nr:NnrS family protein [Vicinamibacterales bacterium]